MRHTGHEDLRYISMVVYGEDDNYDSNDNSYDDGSEEVGDKDNDGN